MTIPTNTRKQRETVNLEEYKSWEDKNDRSRKESLRQGLDQSRDAGERLKSLCEAGRHEENVGTIYPEEAYRGFVQLASDPVHPLSVRADAARMFDAEDEPYISGEILNEMAVVRQRVIVDVLSHPKEEREYAWAANAVGGLIQLDYHQWLYARPDRVGADSARRHLERLAVNSSSHEIRTAARGIIDKRDFGRRSIPKVFVSYVREDSNKVAVACKALTISCGVPLWMDKEQIHGGVRWRAEIRDAIRSGSAFLAFFSEASIKRERTYMREELVEAIHESRLRRHDVPWLIPIRLDPCKIPDLPIGAGETLGDIQHLDLFQVDDTIALQRIASACERALLHQITTGS